MVDVFNELKSIDITDTLPNMINGELIKSNDSIDKYNPLNGEVQYKVSNTSQEELDKAIETAIEAKDKWSSMNTIDRGKILLKSAHLLEKYEKEISYLSTLDSGKSIEDSSGETNGAIQLAQYFGTEGMRNHGRTLESGMYGKKTIVTRMPLGVAGLITAFNSPLPNIAWKVYPALFCGNTVILKPSEHVPRVAIALSMIMEEAGLPKGVLNVVNGGGSKQVGEWIVKDEKIDIVSFTGSYEVGKSVALKCAESFKRYSLELGGKNALVVHEDANLKNAVDWTIKSCFSLAGQRCSSASRLFVHKNIKKDFVNELEKEMNLLIKDSNPLITCPIISKESMERIESSVKEAVDRGANLTKFEIKNSDGFFVQPTLLDGLSNDDQINDKELFGPVATLSTYENIDEVINFVNSSKFGLTASIHTINLNVANKFTEKIRTGTVNVNLGTFGSEPHYPFGGFGYSGNGTREPGLEALDVYSETKTISTYSDL